MSKGKRFIEGELPIFGEGSRGFDRFHGEFL
jgi:hypothetical protein